MQTAQTEPRRYTQSVPAPAQHLPRYPPGTWAAAQAAAPAPPQAKRESAGPASDDAAARKPATAPAGPAPTVPPARGQDAPKPSATSGNQSSALAVALTSMLKQPEPSGTTTYMITNIPKEHNRLDVISILQLIGYGGTFDFLFVPKDFHCKGGKGYAFVNFRDSSIAAKFQNQWHLKPLPISKYVVEVKAAKVQGLRAN